MSASNKKEYLSKINEFCHPDVDHFNKPVIFEVNTHAYDDVMGVKTLRGKPKTAAKATLEANLACPLGVRLLSWFIPNEQKRKKFIEKRSNKG